MSALAAAHGAINLGQGFPDDEGPEELRQAAARAILDGPNQYPPSFGLPALREAVATHDNRFYGLGVDWQSEVLVTSGATEALTDSLLALLNPGDEAILIEPAYDCYRPIIEAAGARPVVVRLDPPDWSLDVDALEAAFSARTKLIVLNSPMNPTGKVFTRAELEAIAELLIGHDAYAVCDEVYEHLVFSGAEHIPLMTLPGMRERCIRIGSAGKTFSLTGWKIGYITAAPQLLSVIAKTHQFVTFTTAPGLQSAVAFGLGKDDSYFEELAADMEAKRDILAAGLADAGFEVLPTDGTYFITTDMRRLAGNEDDLAFCKRLTTEAGVAAVPVSAFYSESEPPSHFVRFCFCKAPQLLSEANTRLREFLG